MCLIEVLISVGMATVVPHVDGCHLGDVQGTVVPKVLWHGEGEKRWKREIKLRNLVKDPGKKGAVKMGNRRYGRGNSGEEWGAENIRREREGKNEGSSVENAGTLKRRRTTAGSDGKRREREESDAERKRDHESVVSLLS